MIALADVRLLNVLSMFESENYCKTSFRHDLSVFSNIQLAIKYFRFKPITGTVGRIVGDGLKHLCKI